LFLENNEWQVQEIKQVVVEVNSVGPDQFVDNNTVMDWMETWGSDDESQSPS